MAQWQWPRIRRLQIAEHEVDDRPSTPLDIGEGRHLPSEDHAQCVLVREIHDAQSAERDVEVDRLDIVPEMSAILPALENTRDDLGQRRAEHPELLRLPKVPRLVEILHR